MTVQTTVLRAHDAAIYGNSTGTASLVGGTDALGDQSDDTYVELSYDGTVDPALVDYVSFTLDDFTGDLDALIEKRTFVRVSGHSDDDSGFQIVFPQLTAPGSGINCQVNVVDADVGSPTTFGGSGVTWSTLGDPMVDTGATWVAPLPGGPTGTATWRMYEFWVEVDWDDGETEPEAGGGWGLG